jgi:antitoxin component of MazEF toxin-antitoxin module
MENHEKEYRADGLVGAASLCVVLPKSYAVNLGIVKGDYVKVHQEDRKIVIEKADQ